MTKLSTKLSSGALMVLFSTALAFVPSGPFDAVADVRREILIVILGVIATPSAQRRSAAVAAGVLLLPTLLLSLLGAKLITLGWSKSAPFQWLGVLGVVQAFTLPALLAAGVLWICVWWFKQKRRRERQ